MIDIVFILFRQADEGVIAHGTGTEIRYQDPSALPWSKMATATTGKDVYTAIIPGSDG